MELADIPLFPFLLQSLPQDGKGEGAWATRTFPQSLRLRSPKKRHSLVLFTARSLVTAARLAAGKSSIISIE